jgi:hypothetical protein
MRRTKTDRQIDTMYVSFIVYQGREKRKRKHPSRVEFESVLEFLRMYKIIVDEFNTTLVSDHENTTLESNSFTQKGEL